MTADEFLERMVELRNAWTTSTKGETNQGRLLDAAESFISGMEEALQSATPQNNHPPPPPPRVRP